MKPTVLALLVVVVSAASKPFSLPSHFAVCDHPHLFSALNRPQELSSDISSNVQPPVWPFQWFAQSRVAKVDFLANEPLLGPYKRNATLAKLGPEEDANPIQWTKFYYDYTLKANRFEFYDHYLNLGLNWTASFVILFANNSIYHIHPLEQKCSIRSCNCPVLSPWWLQQFTYKGSYGFRGGIPADFFQLQFDPSLTYWQRSADLIPLRSTNQANDPGATDYTDVLIGPQNPALFQIPSYCPPCL